MPYTEPEDYRPEQPLRPPASGPMGWEDDALPWFSRLYRTLEATFAPIDSLIAVSNGEIAPALRFTALSALPWMLLWAVIPFTHTLNFGSGFAVSRIESAMPVELDVARAMGIGLLSSASSMLAWALPFVSLLVAFANSSRPEDPGRAAWRTALYRLWVVPFGSALFYALVWALPTPPSPFVAELMVLSLHMMPSMLLMVHAHVMARYFGSSGTGALVVSVVPLIVRWAVSLPLQELEMLLLPAMPPA